jgi:hypothetical protein
MQATTSDNPVRAVALTAGLQRHTRAIHPRRAIAVAAVAIALLASLTALEASELPPSSVQGRASFVELQPEEDAPAAPNASWATATAYPIPIGRYAFAQNGDDMYVISGVTSGALTPTVRRYNATTNAWTSLADIPVASEAAAAAILGSRIYVADGISGGNLIRIYDIPTNTWTSGAARPGVGSSFGAAAGAFNNRVYIIGGGAGGGSTLVSIYDPLGNSWTAGAAAPAAYQLGGYTQVGQYVYLVGGFTSTTGTNSSMTMRYDMANNSWSTGPSWTPQRADLALAARGTRLYAIGGDSNGGGFFDPTTAVSELETNTWPSGAWILSPDILPAARQGNQAGFSSSSRAGDEIWSTGGIGPGTVYLNQHIFRPVSLPCLNYNISQSTGTIQPGTTNVGNNCDDCTTAITLPFPVRFYGVTYTSANVGANGNLQFTADFQSFGNSALPATAFGPTIFPFWDDLRTDSAGSGIFTSVTGTAPQRTFNIEWRVTQFNGTGSTRFQIRFFEGFDHFEFIYGPTTAVFTGTVGVHQHQSGAATQFGPPHMTVPPAGTRLVVTPGCCGPVAFTGAIGSNSAAYPGTSGTQAGRVTRLSPAGTCAAPETYPGTADTTPRTYDAYTFVNNGPATCVTFNVDTACAGTNFVFPVAYLGSFNPANIAQNYLGDGGVSPSPSANFSVNVPANASVVLVVSEVTGGAGCPAYDVVVSGLSCPVQITKAESRKTHGAAGEFNIPLPLTGQPGVEARTGGAGGTHNVVLTLNSDVAGGNATVSSGIGTAGAPTFLGRTMIIPLSGVTDLQRITLSLSNVFNTVGQVLPTTGLNINILLGDTNGNRAVNATDIGQVKSQAGAPVSPANFRTDTTASGAINASDVGQVKANAGNSLP